ncbi:hypothetical protein D3C72_1309500 [compost metagenome]
MEICWLRPSRRCMVTPGRRARDSAIETSGSLPMSSAEMTSTIEVLRALAEIEASIERRMPVTTISSTWVAWSSCEAVCAWAPPARARVMTTPKAPPVMRRARRVKPEAIVILP